MFSYPEKTKVNIELKINEVLKTIKATKEIKEDSLSIDFICLSNILSTNTTGLESSNFVKEIYIIDITLNSHKIPYLFVENFNKNINLQTLFKFHFNDDCYYYLSLKYFENDKVKILKIFESDWQKQNKIEFPTTIKLEKVLKEMIQYITKYNFREEETFEKYIERLNTIKLMQTEIQRQTKMMLNEKQPNLKMEMNDKIKSLKKDLQKMEE